MFAARRIGLTLVYRQPGARDSVPEYGSGSARFTSLLTRISITAASGWDWLSLIWNSVKAPTPNDRRKTQGHGLGNGRRPRLPCAGIRWNRVDPAQGHLRLLPFGLVGCRSSRSCSFLFSFAYAVVKHRVLEIPGT